MADPKPKAKSAVEPVPTFQSATANLDGLGWVAHGILAVMGLLAIVAAFAAWRADVTTTLVVALVLIGVALPILAWFSLMRSRAAWSFLISVGSVLCIMTAFGAPKVRSLVGVSMGLALIIPALIVIAIFGLSVQVHRYKD